MAETDCHRRIQEHCGHRRLSPAAPIGVFDSGIGGLSVLRALRARLPQEDFVYFADNAHAPYGERPDRHVIDRSLAIAQQLRGREGIKALVVACNTATAAAIDLLRAAHPDLPIVGVEPALKPAAACTRTGRVGVLATRGTLASARFGALLASLQGQARFALQPCDGLAEAVEQADATKIRALCDRYIRATGQFGSNNDDMDTLVLGCTHYPFASDVLRSLVGPEVALLDTGEPVARQLGRRLDEGGLRADHRRPGRVAWQASGPTALLTAAAARWLAL
ncbi:MAG: glutamate racemase [Ramlibacter sp.]|nr:glutamate racemase [Ramlibacter sp.]